MIHRSPLADLDIPDIPLTDFVLENAAAMGDKPAFIDGPTGRVLTYSGLVGGVAAMAGGLVSRGFGP
ncbi:MAG: 4-coumarate--CoA ligase family protein, partial [Acidimicrobiia bacterium]|nr:4-coumarate--CoA ligase family protein [Acidimicrobiia bacterium]